MLFKNLCAALSLATILMSQNAYSGEVIGTVKEVLTRIDGLHYIYMNGAPTNKPACATIGYWMIKDENSVAGKSQFSQLLTAYATGKTVKIYGNNTCTRWGDGEDINAVQLRSD